MFGEGDEAIVSFLIKSRLTTVRADFFRVRLDGGCFRR